MNKKLRYFERLGFLDYAEAGNVYDIEVSGELKYRNVLCTPEKAYNCVGCCLYQSDLSCISAHDKYVCGAGKLISLDEIVENL